MSNYKKLIEIKLFGSRDLKSFSNIVEVIEKDYKKSYSKKSNTYTFKMNDL